LGVKASAARPMHKDGFRMNSHSIESKNPWIRLPPGTDCY
jgi:hypothetical protein